MPCRALFGHERSLVQRYEGKPFVLLGVNAGESREELAEVEGRAGLTWRSWWDGPDGPIARRLGVTVYPTLYLLDHHGVVRFESQGVPDLDVLDQQIEQ